MRRVALASVAVASLLAAGCGGGTGQSAPSGTASTLAGTPIGPGTSATDFALTDQNGRTVRLSDERGKPVLVTFLYTHCPDVCPLIAQNLNTALRNLGADRSRVSVLGVSVDPRNDTPAAVRKFVAEHRLLPEFRYLTGTAAELGPVWQAYNVLVEPRGGIEQLAHGSFTLLVDANGEPVAYYDPQASAADYAHDLRVELARP
jgi:protein SCO1/2